MYDIFANYLNELVEIERNINHDNFVKVQKMQADILNDYTNGKLNLTEMKTAYSATSIMLDHMRIKLRSDI